jgi:hypothetical protein
MNLMLKYLDNKYRSINPLELNQEINYYDKINNYEEFVIERFFINDISEILILKISLEHENHTSFKYDLLRDYIKEMIKYNYDCLKDLHSDLDKYNLSSYTDLQDLTFKVKSLSQKDVDNIFVEHPELYPNQLIFMFEKTHEILEVLNNPSFTDFISYSNKKISLKKFNSIIYEIDIPKSINPFTL